MWRSPTPASLKEKKHVGKVFLFLAKNANAKLQTMRSLKTVYLELSISRAAK